LRTAAIKTANSKKDQSQLWFSWFRWTFWSDNKHQNRYHQTCFPGSKYTKNAFANLLEFKALLKPPAGFGGLSPRGEKEGRAGNKINEQKVENGNERREGGSEGKRDGEKKRKRKGKEMGKRGKNKKKKEK